MFTSLKRIFRSGLLDFWRNSVVSLSSVFVMTVTLFVIGSLIFLQATLASTLLELKSKVDINVYFIPQAAEGAVLALSERIEELPEVASVEYVSREQALNNFRELHANDQLTLQALEELEDNPLGAVLNIQAKDTTQYESINRFLETADGGIGAPESIIDNVNFNQNRVAIERLTEIIAASERLGVSAAGILVLLSLLITFNTIRLAIYTARDEIAVMRLVGASNTYIRGPFVVEGIIAGLSAAIIAIALFFPLTYWLGPLTENFFGGINLYEYYIVRFPEIVLIIAGVGALLGAVSSFMAVKRYLKV